MSALGALPIEEPLYNTSMLSVPSKVGDHNANNSNSMRNNPTGSALCVPGYQRCIPVCTEPPQDTSTVSVLLGQAGFSIQGNAICSQTAPRLFTALVNAMVKWTQSHDIQMLAYLVDWLIYNVNP